MTRRLLDNVTNEFERQLLRAGQSDEMPKQSRAALLAYFNVASPMPGRVEVPELPTGTSPPALGAEGAASGLTQGLAGALSTGKGLLTAAAFGALGALGAFAVLDYRTPPADEPIVPAEPAPLAPTLGPSASRPASPTPSAATASSEREAKPPAAAPKARPELPRTLPAKSSSNTLANELKAIDAARQALASRDAHGALRQLEQYRRNYPRGNLRTEAAVLRIEALAARGDRASAARLARAFLESQPKSPYTRRMQSLLARLSSATSE